jgi:hypothetical protein
MRKPLALLLAAALIAAVVAWSTREGFAVSVVPGWHTTILAPYAVVAMFVSAVLLAIAFSIMLWQLGGGKRSP